MNGSTIQLTAQTRVKHAALLRLSRQLGGLDALATSIGVSKSLAFQYVNLRNAPPAEPCQNWNADKVESVKANIESLTGQRYDLLFPDELRRLIEANKLCGTIEKTAEIPLAGLLEYAEQATPRLITCDPSEEAELSELRDKMDELLSTLTEREQRIIINRYGLHGKRPLNLEETAQLCGVTRERIRQIEMRALRRMRMTADFAVRELADEIPLDRELADAVG